MNECLFIVPWQLESLLIFHYHQVILGREIQSPLPSKKSMTEFHYIYSVSETLPCNLLGGNKRVDIYINKRFLPFLSWHDLESFYRFRTTCIVANQQEA